ncbi:3-phosphoshikimate 1-carboxyvinyltransferase [Verrucomicrobiia bacterium DG1235]|nr:3-phosphoshikimate 1-carboxyvinyltransferase [Verrucomicrobiae bacterium DG1235]
MQDPHPIIPFTTPVNGSVTVPGSKSITNRALIIAALANGETLLENCLFSEDTEIMVKALQDLGFEIQPDRDAKTIRVSGLSGQIPNKQANIFVGNSGTSARFLTAFLCLSEGGDYTLDGVPQMRKRPIADLAETLNQLGAEIETTNGFAPLRIKSRGLRGGRASIDASSSSQFVSALVMAAPYATEGVEIVLADTSVRRGYIDMTLEMLKQFGVPKSALASSESGYSIQRHTPYQAKPEGYLVEGDASAASYFFALPVAVTGQLEIHGVTKKSLQGDIAFSTRMEEAGAYIEWHDTYAVCHYEPGAQPESLQGSFYPYSDTFLTAAAIAPLLNGPTTIEEIGHTRHQECDRIAAMADGLQRLGQIVAETEGSLTITPQPLQPSSVATYHDHRVAMSFGILGCYDALGNGQPWLQIENPTCCKKTFPDFFQVLEKLRQESLIAKTDA